MLAPTPTLVEIARLRATERRDDLVFRFLDSGEIDGPTTTLSFGELDRRARAVAARLDGARGERAILVFPPGLDLIVALYGCFYAGVIAVPAYPPDPTRLARTLPRLRAMVTDSEARLALTTEALLGLADGLFAFAPELAALRWIGIEGGDPEGEPDWDGPLPSGEDVAFLQYTSGSTGSPKGVVLPHRSVVHNMGLIQRAADVSPQTRLVSWLPPYHDLGLVCGILMPVYVGFSATLLSPVDFLRRPFRWIAAVAQERATHSGGPNFAFDLCARRVTEAERAGLDLSAWEVAFNGAEPIRPDTLARFAGAFAPCGFRPSAFTPCYGLAEITLGVAVARRAQRPGRIRAADGDHRAVVSCGGVGAPEHEVLVVDPESRRPCPEAALGEIWIRSPSVAGGYWGRPEETAATFEARRADTGEGPYLRTGDLGFVHEGEVFPVARIKDLVIVGGRKHHPQDLERSAERSHPAVRPGGVAAFGLEESRAGAREGVGVVAEVDARRLEGPGAAEAVVLAIAQEIAADHELTATRIALIEPGALPKTSSGKVQRRATRAGLLDGTLAVVHDWALGSDGGDAHAPAPEAPSPEAPAPEAPAPEAPSPEAPAPEAPSPEAPSPEAPEATITRFLLDWLRARTGAPLRDTTPLAQLGLDSVVVAELASALEGPLGRRVDPAVVWAWPTVGALARGLLAATPAAGDGIPFARSEAPYGPLSFGERDLFDIVQGDSRQEAYNLFVPLRVTAPPDPPRVRRALAWLIARHESLRTRFETVDGEPARRVETTVDVPLDVRRVEEEPAAVAAACDAVRHHRFDLAVAPLFAGTLLDFGDRGLLLLAFNHLVVDAWSLGVIQRELALAWRALEEGALPTLPPPPLRPHDYAMSVNAALRDVLDRGAAGLPPVPADAWRFPLDAPRPLHPRADGAVHRSLIEADLWGAARAVAARARLPPAAAALVAFQVALHRHARAANVDFSVVHGNRAAPELRGLVGFLIHSERFAAQCSPGDTWMDLLARTRDALLVQRKERMAVNALLRPPSIRLVFNFHNFDAAAGGELAPFELAVEHQRYAYPWAVHDLLLQVFPMAGGLHLAALYRSEVIGSATMDALAAGVRAAIAAMVADPEAAVGGG